jgi:flagellar secretion chaperone FliS
MSARSPWNSYRQVAMQTAAPGRVVLMLFEGAIRFLERAEQGFALEDPAEANQTIHNNIQRAQEIVHELNMALDLEQGGDLARTLRSLYEYMDRRLLESNLRKSLDGLVEVKKHLTSLRGAWDEMLRTRETAPENGMHPVLAAA